MIQSLKAGDRIRLVVMRNDPDPIPAGQAGTVTRIYPHGSWHQVEVDWDSGRSLMLVVPPDRFELITGAADS